MFKLSIIIVISLFSKISMSSDELLISKIINKIPKNYTQTIDNAKRIIPVAIEISNQIGVSPDLVISVMWAESHFKSNAVSSVGARGLMQVMSKTKKEVLLNMKNYNEILTLNLNKGLNYNELESIIVGTYYLKYLKKRFKKREFTIIAYNMGPTWVANKLYKKEQFGNNHDYLIKVSNKIKTIAYN